MLFTTRMSAVATYFDYILVIRVLTMFATKIFVSTCHTYTRFMSAFVIIFHIL